MLHRLKAWIDEHLAEAMTLADMAAQTELSEYHFAHMFKQSTGYRRINMYYNNACNARMTWRSTQPNRLPALPCNVVLVLPAILVHVSNSTMAIALPNYGLGEPPRLIIPFLFGTLISRARFNSLQNARIFGNCPVVRVSNAFSGKLI